MRPIPSEADLLTAIDRLGAGLGPRARWDEMSFAKAQSILRQAVDELICLRSQHRLWICAKCSMMHTIDGMADSPPCPTCGQPMHSEGELRLRGLQRRVAQLEGELVDKQEIMAMLLEFPGATDDEEGSVSE